MADRSVSLVSAIVDGGSSFARSLARRPTDAANASRTVRTSARSRSGGSGERDSE